MAALSSMNKESLIRYADDNGVAIDPTKTKAEIKAAIEAATKAADNAPARAQPAAAVQDTYSREDVESEFAVLSIVKLQDGSEMANTVTMDELADQGVNAAITGAKADRQGETFVSNVMLMAKHAYETARARNWKADSYVASVITAVEEKVRDQARVKAAHDPEFPLDQVNDKIKNLMKVYRSQVSTAVADGIEIGKTYSVMVERKNRKTGAMEIKPVDVKADSPNTLARIRREAKAGNVPQLEKLKETTSTSGVTMSDALANEINAIKELLAKVKAGTNTHEQALTMIRKVRGALEALDGIKS